MARIALPSDWLGSLGRQRGPLRTYQWLWLLFCLLGALLAATPRILSQPIFYTTTAAVQIDVGQRYRELYTNGQPDADFAAVENQSFEQLLGRFPEFGSPTFGVRLEAQPDGLIRVTAFGRTAAEAQLLADAAAETLARNVRAAGGREILRNLMGWELTESLKGNEPGSPFQQDLRELIRTAAFPLNRPIEPVSQYVRVDELAPEDLSDLTRALEVREDQLRLIEIPALQARRSTAAPDLVAAIDADLRRMEEGRRAIRLALTYLYRERGAAFDPDLAGGAYRSQRAAQPNEPVDRRIPLLIGLTIVVGLGFGGAGVLVDRTAGVMAKLRELWEYRELIRNLVLRDLRTRYKGSLLGYLWTQIAPLLNMLVFWLVFSFFLPGSGLALFPIFLIVGLLTWGYTAEAVVNGARSIIDNANLIKKVFFPREVLPLVSVFSSLVNLLLSLPMLLLVMAIVQWLEIGRLNFAWTFLYLPILLIIQTIFLAGVALFASALAVFFRDTVHLLGVLVQFWFFLTPVVYALDSAIGPLARVMRWVNPMASLIEFYREVLYGRAVPVGLIPTPGLPALDSVLRVLLTAVVTLAIGYWFFQRRSGDFGEAL